MDSRLGLSGLAVVALGALVAVGVAFAALSGDEPPPPNATQTGVIQVTLTLETEPPVAARTWTFEVADSRGTVVDRVVLSTADTKLTVTGRTSPLPRGDYTVRQVLSSDERPECGRGALFAVVSPPSGEASVRLDSAGAAATFLTALCP